MPVQSHDVTIAIDVSTLFVLATCLSGLLGLFLLGVWRQERIQALAWWGAAYLLGGFAVALWIVRGAAGILPSGVPSALLFLACGMIWNAARVFHGRPVLWVAMSAGAATWLLATAFPDFMAAQPTRVAVSSVIIAVYTFLTAFELWRERRKALIQRWPALFVPLLHGLVFLVPVPLASMMPEEHGIVSLATGWFAVFALEAILYVVGTAFIVVTLSKDQAVRVQRTAAHTDPLTGLFNRRAFFEGAPQLRAAQKHKGAQVGALVFDLDHFKAINDRYGHFVGDEVLKLFASVIASNIRTTDLVARFGGEEFVVLLPGGVDEAAIAGERVRAAFEIAGRSVGAHTIGATVSVGAAAGAATVDLSELLMEADAALYRAKALGRNRVMQAVPGEALLAAQAPAEVAAVGALDTTNDTQAWAEAHAAILWSVDPQANRLDTAAA